jgi:type I restriction enzyme M protein
MRISPVGFLFNSIEEVKMESYKATITSHNHPEAIKSAEAVAVSIFMLRTDFSKDEVKKYIEDNYFSLNYDLDNLSENYEFTSRAINSVPQAIFCFLQSNDFEDAIRKAISIGGDCDTIAAITGSLAEAYYSVPEELIEMVKPYISNYMFPILDKFYERKKIKVYGRINSVINK